MTILSFIIQVMSGATMLLFAVHVMRIGIEARLGGWVRRALDRDSSALGLAGKGGVLGFAMQGGTVVLLMAAAMASSGTLSVASAAILGIGAEVGSAIAVNVLHLSPALLGPLLILVGGWLFLNCAETSKTRETGRIILGLGLIFLALSLIRAAVSPLQGSPHMAGALDLIGSDPVNAVLLGIALSFLMHSSLVALLTAAAFLGHSALPPVIVIGFVLGCNMGSAVLPLWLLRGADQVTKTVARSVAAMRSGLAVVLLLVLIVVGSDGMTFLHQAAPVDILLYGHLAFNLALLVGTPCVRPINRFFTPQKTAAPQVQLKSSQLQESPELVLAEFKRRVNGMLETLGVMIGAVTAKVPDRAALIEGEAQTNQNLTELRKQFARLPDLPEEILEQVQDMLDYAIRIERSADILSSKYIRIRLEEEKGYFTLTPQGSKAIKTQVADLKKATVLAQHVFWKEDQSGARQLIQMKQEMTALEQANRRDHFEEIRMCNATALECSDHYIEIAAALKEITSKLATIGYVVLDRHGGLKKTRVKTADRG
ncbi:MAG: Na/Pi symporter [Paracoccaceae bacterium]